MGMNDEEIERVVGELRSGLLGIGLQTAWQPSRDRVVLGFSDGTMLLIVPRGPYARVHTVRNRPRNPPKPFSFQGACRAHLHGPLTAIDRAPGDRVVRITFARGALEVRLTGRSGGLWLLEGESIVAAVDGPAPERLPELPARPPYLQAPRFEPEGGSWNRGADRWFGDQERERQTSELRSRVEAQLSRAVSRNDRLRENLEQDLARADRAPALRHQADLLAANLYRVPRGASAVAVEDWESGETVNVALDPSKPASASLEKLYHQVKRLERVADRVLERLDQIEREQLAYRASLTALPTLDLDSLGELERQLPRLDAVRRRADAPAAPYTTWVGPNGWRVLVGRNAGSNRKLTFQTAKGYDWWMHLRERPGAHLVLPTPKDQSPPLAHLLAAAQIALHTARVEPHEVMDLQYTRVRDVRSVPGSPGLVTLSNERVLRVARDPAALVGWVTTEQE